MRIHAVRGLLLGALIALPLLTNTPQAEAQRRGSRARGGFGGQSVGGQSGGVFPLPEGVNRLVAVDALSIILVESSSPGNPNDRQYNVIRPRHLPSAGIARLFGGTVITTEELLGLGNTGGGGNNGGGGFGGGFGGSGFGATNIGGGSTNGGGFGGDTGGGNTGGGGFGGDTGGFGGGTTTTGQTLNDIPGLLGSALGGANFATQEVGAQ